MTNQEPITPSEILQSFPFPIAFDFQELDAVHIKPTAWREKSYRLRDLFATVLRFISVVALGELETKQKKSLQEDAEINRHLHRLLLSPLLEDYLAILKLSMRVFTNATHELVIPELYSFCYTPDGQETANLQILGRILTYDKELNRLGAAGESDEYKELYLRYGGNNYAGFVWDLLKGIRFLTDYQFLRLIDSRQKDDVFTWKLKVLQGISIDPPIEQWEREEPLQEGELAIWDPRKFNLLYLPPYAIFHECDVCKDEGLVPVEGVFLYERWDQDEALYIGTRNSERGLVHHIHIKDRKYIEPLQRVLGLMEQPVPPSEPSSVAIKPYLDWGFVSSVVRDRSEGQIAQFERMHKYDQTLYLNRVALEAQFQTFLASPSIGFLVIGDAGTGKTNLLCHLTKSLLEANHRTALLYNCADFPDDISVAREIARSLGHEIRQNESPVEGLTRILSLLDSRRPQDGIIVVLFDAINEYRKPKELMASINDLVTLVRCPWLKVVFSCRSESWKILSRSFKVEHQFYATAEGGKENIIRRFSEDELPRAYNLYKSKYQLQTPYELLSPQAKKFIADPLRLSFVAESFLGKIVPPDLRSRLVLQKYKEAKIGNPNNQDLDQMENTLVSRLVDVMFEKRIDQLRIKDLWDDPVIGNWIRNRDVDSPYMQLIDKGVLQETGPRDNFQQQLSKVKFTYERVFEYLLAVKVYPESPDPEQIIEHISSATRYTSLWGAIKIALIMHTEAISLGPKSLLSKLCKEDRFDVRGMMVDTLVTYSHEKPDEVDQFCQYLLSTNNDAASTVAIMTAYNIGSKQVLLSSIRHTTPSIRQTGAQFVYFFWHRNREQGDQLLQEFVDGVNQDLKRAIPQAILNKALGKEFDLEALPAIQSFTEMSVYLGAHLMRNPKALSQAAHLWSNLLANVPGGIAGRMLLAQKMRQRGAKLLIEAYKAGGVMNYKNFHEYSNLSMEHRQRQLVRECTVYMKILRREEIPAIENELLEMASFPNAFISTFCGTILINYLLSKQESALRLVTKLIGENDQPYDFKRFNGLQALAYATIMMQDPPQSYLDLLINTVRGTWNDPLAKITLAGQDYSGRHVIILAPAIAAICRFRPTELHEFVNELCKSALHLSEKDRTELVIELLADSVGLIEPNEMDPIFDILSTGFDAEEYQDALSKAFANLWRQQSDRLDSILSDPDMNPDVIVATRKRVEKLKESQSHFGFGISTLTSLMFIEPVQDYIINAITASVANATNTDMGIGAIGSAIFDPDCIKAVADWLPQ